MNRRKKAAGLALLVGGVLWALPALAQKSAEQCTLDCDTKANTQVSTCAQGCPTSDPNKKEVAGACMAKCAERYHSTKSACVSSCPKPAPAQKEGGN